MTRGEGGGHKRCNQQISFPWDLSTLGRQKKDDNENTDSEVESLHVGWAPGNVSRMES